MNGDSHFGVFAAFGVRLGDGPGRRDGRAGVDEVGDGQAQLLALGVGDGGFFWMMPAAWRINVS